MLTATDVSADPVGYIATCLVLLALGAGIWQLIRKEREE